MKKKIHRLHKIDKGYYLYVTANKKTKTPITIPKPQMAISIMDSEEVFWSSFGVSNAIENKHKLQDKVSFSIHADKILRFDKNITSKIIIKTMQ